jgi:hypothetical protein
MISLYAVVCLIKVIIISGLDVLRAASSLEETRRECGLKFPDRVHATNLRKHCATIAQVR